MSATNMLIIARKEVRDALRNRWLLVFAAAFALLALAVSYMSRMGTDLYAADGFGRAAAGLVNLVLLVVPLMALVISASSITGERERGTLAYLLAQPLGRIEMLIGKYIGLAAALLSALAIGFGLSAAVIAFGRGGADVGGYLTLVGLTCMLALAMLSVGMMIAMLCPRVSVATGAAIFGWLALVFLTDLALMGSAVVFKLQVGQLFDLVLINPLQVFKLAVLYGLNTSMDVLGPAGQYAATAYGSGLMLIFIAALTAWIVVPFSLTTVIFIKRGTP